MTDRQQTFGDIVGMDSNVPTRPHADDWVECSDGSVRREAEVFYDCRDNAHGTEEDRHEADATIVTEVLDGVAKWAEEYCTENTDYADGYAHVLCECSHEWPQHVKEWIEDSHCLDYDDCIDELVTAVCEELDADDAEATYNGSDYGGYSGEGCCLDGFKIEEYEEQIDISCHDELQELHNQARLDDVLDDVKDYEFYLHRSRRREKNECTGYYEDVGRKTYMPYEHNAKHPTFEITVGISGGWDFVVSKERMDEAVAIAITELCRRKDG